jgi:tetratricopeptide (TPR) repeat protein
MPIGELFDQNSGISPDFLRGLKELELQRYDQALVCFKTAHATSGDACSYLNTYLSYIGLAYVLRGDQKGIKYCRRAAHFEKYNSNVYHNLAIAELQIGDRKRAVDAIHSGLVVDSENEKLLQLRGQMGVRSKAVLPFLNRDSFLNRLVGRYMRIRSGFKGHAKKQDVA